MMFLFTFEEEFVAKRVDGSWFCCCCCFDFVLFYFVLFFVSLFLCLFVCLFFLYFVFFKLPFSILNNSSLSHK